VLSGLRSRLTYANVMASIAVFGVLAGGGAYAASKIRAGDIAKNAVRSKHIKTGVVTSADLKDGKGVRGRDVANGSIGTAKLVANGDFVAPGLGEGGGEGDCVWHDASELSPGLNPVGYYRDRFGTVHLSGATISEEIAGVGDEECGATDPEPDDSLEDSIIFTLPPALRPANAIVRPIATGTLDRTGLVLVAGDAPFSLGGDVIPPGSVVGGVQPGDLISFEGFSFATAAAAVQPTAATAAAQGSPPSPELEGLLLP